MTTAITLLGPKTRVRWTAAKGGWTANGLGMLTNFDPQRAYFGATKGSGKDTSGPAYEIQLDAVGERDGLRVWVPLEEVEEVVAATGDAN